MDSYHLNNSFHYTSFLDKTEEGEDLEEKNPNNLSKIILFPNIESLEPQIMNTTANLFEPNLNLSQLQNKKKNPMEDISYIEQNFNENSHMILEEEFRGVDNNYKIENTGIEPIIEMNSFEQGINDSFLHENNNFLLHNFNNINSISLENNINNLTAPINDINKMDITVDDDSELLKIKKNLMSIKLSKSSISKNKTMKTSINQTMLNDSSKKIFNVYTQDNLNNSMKLNMSSCLFNSKIKRGRKKILLDGLKTELMDKAFIREFKKYIKLKQESKQFDNIFEKDPIFWKEFSQNSVAPFIFTVNGEKVKYKSYNKQLLKMLFSRPDVRKLYSFFVNDREKDFSANINMKKIKKLEHNLYLFSYYYGKNLHKIYSDEYSANEISFENDDMSNMSLDNTNMSL
jgi:hypothetical protein